MKKVGIIYLILAILCSILVVLPDYINNIEINKINKEKANFEEQITIKCFNTKALKEKYKNNITRINSKKEKEIENSIINYNKIINDGFIFSKNRLIIEDVSNKETIDELNEKIKLEKNNLEKYKANIEGIKGLKLDIYYTYIEKYNNYFDTTISNLSYLNDNKNYWNEEDSKIIFTKRVKFNEYKEIENNNSLIKSKAELIKDVTGPVITASNISIFIGDKLDLNSKIKCYDEVDDMVECKISGSYDNNKKGTYNINIEASDLSGNKSSKEIKINVNEKTKVVSSTGKPYYIEVIRNMNTVIVYGLDTSNNYTKIVKVFPCSVGRNNWTPTGVFKTTRGGRWGGLFGNVYGQYTTRITGNILFHSVPYYHMDNGSLEWEEYNKLGTAASAGCVRMTVKDVKWIYDNCGSGTTVKIYDGSLPSGVSKPSAPKIDGSSPNRGWDPTDPDPNNPWK